MWNCGETLLHSLTRDQSHETLSSHFTHIHMPHECTFSATQNTAVATTRDSRLATVVVVAEGGGIYLRHRRVWKAEIGRGGPSGHDAARVEREEVGVVAPSCIVEVEERAC
eukprot:scaffold127453_cov72-Phaeocystis_antarctica.AAC.2